MDKSKREFIKESAVGMAGLLIGGLGMPSKSYSKIIGANDRLNVAIVGLGRRVHAWPEPIAAPESNVHLSYLCDVMESRREDAAERFSEVLDYQPELENDVRKIIDDSEVDALIIATPDHWHAPGTCYAVQSGKHVYVEKPGSHNPHEAELLVAFQQKYDMAIQLGNHRRSSVLVREMIEEIQSGLIGEPYEAVASYTNRRGQVPVATNAPVPDGLDWNLFQGPAPRQEYIQNVWDYDWHWYGWKWGTAEAGNNAIHSLDIARWALQVEYPKKVIVDAHKRHFPQDGWTMYDTMNAALTFPGDKVIKWDCKSRNNYDTYGSQGPIIYGTEGAIMVESSQYKLYDREGNLVRERSADDSKYSTRAQHVMNFFDGVRGKGALNSPIEEGSRSALMCHLLNIAARTDKNFDINSENGRIYDKEAMQLWSREYEPGWEPVL